MVGTVSLFSVISRFPNESVNYTTRPIEEGSSVPSSERHSADDVLEVVPLSL